MVGCLFLDVADALDCLFLLFLGGSGRQLLRALADNSSEDNSLDVESVGPQMLNGEGGWAVDRWSSCRMAETSDVLDSSWDVLLT